MATLLRAFIRDEAALRRLLARYLTRPDDVEEVLQEAFLQAFAADAQTTIRRPGAYLRRAARNLAISHLRKKAFSHTRYIEDLPASHVLGVRGNRAAGDEAATRQGLMVVSQAIAALPEMRRRALILRRVEGCSMKEVARKLNITVSTAEKHVAAGIRQCIELLEAQGHDIGDLMQPALERHEPTSIASVASARAHDQD